MKPMNDIEAEQLCSSAEQALRHGSIRLGSFSGLLRRIIEERLWVRRMVLGEGLVELNNLRELVTFPPWKGWGEWAAPFFCTKGYESTGWVGTTGFRLCGCGRSAAEPAAAQPAANSAGVWYPSEL